MGIHLARNIPEHHAAAGASATVSTQHEHDTGILGMLIGEESAEGKTLLGAILAMRDVKRGTRFTGDFHLVVLHPVASSAMTTPHDVVEHDAQLAGILG